MGGRDLTSLLALVILCFPCLQDHCTYLSNAKKGLETLVAASLENCYNYYIFIHTPLNNLYPDRDSRWLADKIRTWKREFQCLFVSLVGLHQYVDAKCVLELKVALVLKCIFQL